MTWDKLYTPTLEQPQGMAEVCASTTVSPPTEITQTLDSSFTTLGFIPSGVEITVYADKALTVAVTFSPDDGITYISTGGSINVAAGQTQSIVFKTIGNRVKVVITPLSSTTFVAYEIRIWSHFRVTSVQGDRLHDQVDGGGPIKLGGKASSSLPTAVSSGDRVDAFFDLYGRLAVGDGMTHGTLADGQAAIAETDVYTAPASGAVLSTIRFTNAGSSIELVKVYVKRSGGTSRLIAQQSLAGGDRLDAIAPGEKIELSSGDKIRALTTTATTVDYLVAGAV